MNKVKVYSLNTQLYKVTGVEKVMMDVHHALSDTYDCKIVGTINYDQVQPDHHIKKEDYIKWSTPFLFRKSIVIVHERKLLPWLWLLNHLFFQQIKIVYVHHNLLYGHKLLSRMPKTVVAIADRGIDNLHNYFGVPLENITKIHNCVEDIHPKPHDAYDGGKVKILYPARINDQKRQLVIVQNLKGKLDSRIQIRFAGDGPKYEELRNLIKDDPQFVALGYCNDIHTQLQQSDYMMLFSAHEGLPITLIEAAMTGTPAICSEVGGNTEIVDNGVNGHVLDKDDWDGLLKLLNSLPFVSKESYKEMSGSARKKYEEKFTFEQFRDNYQQLIKLL